MEGRNDASAYSARQYATGLSITEEMKMISSTGNNRLFALFDLFDLLKTNNSNTANNSNNSNNS